MRTSEHITPHQIGFYTVEYSNGKRLYCEFICSDCARQLEAGELTNSIKGQVKELSQIGFSLEACDYCGCLPQADSKISFRPQGGRYALQEAV
jgi:hypothetical protein